MGRSPSPKRKRDRPREKSKRRKRSRTRSRSRKRSSDRRRRHQSFSDVEEYDKSRTTRSRSYERDRRRSPVPSSSKVEKGKPTSDVVDFDDQDMKKVMGFSGFSSTKGKKVEGNDVGQVHVILKRKYRQYMNRKGGFNRPLDFVA